MLKPGPSIRVAVRTARKIPSFSLYGERPGADRTDCLHIEDIQSRSRKYLWRIDTHRHAVLSQCVLVAGGPVRVMLEEADTDSSGPVLAIIPAGTIHSFRFRADTQGHVLTVDLDRLMETTAAPHQLPIQALFAAPRVIDLRADPSLTGRVLALLSLLAREFRQPDALHTPICRWLAHCALTVLAHGLMPQGALNTPAAQDLERLRRFRLLIESNHPRHWPVHRYAQQLGLSQTSLNRLCRELAGATAFDLVQQRLALEARRRLIFAASSVGSIAAELGFKDAAYFSRFFRRHCGLSPNEFRRLQAGG
jgi:AraC family transcriptional activator of pobA